METFSPRFRAGDDEVRTEDHRQSHGNAHPRRHQPGRAHQRFSDGVQRRVAIALTVRKWWLHQVYIIRFLSEEIENCFFGGAARAFVFMQQVVSRAFADEHSRRRGLANEHDHGAIVHEIIVLSGEDQRVGSDKFIAASELSLGSHRLIQPVVRHTRRDGLRMSFSNRFMNEQLILVCRGHAEWKYIRRLLLKETQCVDGSQSCPRCTHATPPS